ncbi:hypothetical protein [Actinophytocola sediminis]
MVELLALVVVAGAVHLDRSEESIGFVVGGIARGEPGKGVGDLLFG